MQIIRREFDRTENESFSGDHAQASYNSDGRMTLRVYDRGDKKMDKIIVFDNVETEAIIKLIWLMRNFDLEKSSNDLPF